MLLLTTIPQTRQRDCKLITQDLSREEFETQDLMDSQPWFYSFTWAPRFTRASLVAQLHGDSACNVGHPGSIPGLGRSPGEGNGKPLQYSVLENSMDRGAWQATVHGVMKGPAWLRDFHFHFDSSQNHHPPICGKIVFHETSPWCPKGWGPVL